MGVITISRGSFSGGTVVAECLAEKLGHRLLSREVLAAAAARYGVAESKLAEVLDRAPGLWERFGQERRLYLAFIQAALCDTLLEGGGVVYHGHAGHLLLRGVGHVLRVRLIAPLDYRVSAAMERLHVGCDAAMAHIRRVDEERARWTKFLYGIDWNDPLLYDLTVNLEAMSVETACAAIAFTAAQPEYVETEVSRHELADLAIACRVRAALAADAATARVDLEVTAADGVVTLAGRPRSPEDAAAAVAVARAVPGVTGVLAEGLAAWKYGGGP